MTIWADIVEHFGPEGIESIGPHQFVSVPRIGDEVQIVGSQGDRRFVEVIRVSHIVVGLEYNDRPASGAIASVRVTVRRKE